MKQPWRWWVERVDLEFRSLCPSQNPWASSVALVVKNPHTNARDAREVGSTPKSGRFPGGRHGNLLKYSCLENPMNRGTWGLQSMGSWKSLTRLKWLSTHTCTEPMRGSMHMKKILRTSSETHTFLFIRSAWGKEKHMYLKTLLLLITVQTSLIKAGTRGQKFYAYGQYLTCQGSIEKWTPLYILGMSAFFLVGGRGNRVFLALLHGMWGLSSLTRIKPVPRPVEAQSPNHWTARKFP